MGRLESASTKAQALPEAGADTVDEVEMEEAGSDGDKQTPEQPLEAQEEGEQDPMRHSARGEEWVQPQQGHPQRGELRDQCEALESVAALLLKWLQHLRRGRRACDSKGVHEGEGDGGERRRGRVLRPGQGGGQCTRKLP